MAIRIMQGDAYDLRIEILDDYGNPVKPDDESDVEIVHGHMVKTYANEEIKHGEDCWLLPITQEESFALPPSKPKAQLRVKWKTGEVDGCYLDLSAVWESFSREVL